MFPTLQIGPVALQTPGLILILGIWLGLSAAEKHAPRFGIEPDFLYKTVLIALAAGLAGARLAFAAGNLPAFLAAPAALISLTPQMLDLSGGLLAGALAGIIYAWRKKAPAWSMLDALTPGLAVFAIAAALANLASGNAFGAPTHVPWGIALWGEIRHPSQVYELIAAAGTALLIWPRRLAPAPFGAASPVSGALFLTFVIFQSGARLFLETFRGDSILIAGTVRLSQVAAWLVLAVGLAAYNHRPGKPSQL
jgi:phosphatidylglycerol:prolipoprotein diacylglycerol transferase